MINKDRKFCYRITHIDNLRLLIQNGIVNKNHPNASEYYIEIGNREIIDVRSVLPVKISEYGMIGEYVPFYFTPKSIMLFNILTGYWHPLVPQRKRDEIIVIRCLIENLKQLPKWFFTDGQANIRDGSVKHYNDLSYLYKIDWNIIQQSDFSKNTNDFERPRRYQAEFLVHHEVPFSNIESLNVYDQQTAIKVNTILNENNINLAVNIQPQYFFK